jgi:hypothetical protein
VFWVFFAVWFGIFATIALIIVVNYRGFGRSSPELNHIGRDEFDEEAERERSYTRRRRRRELGIVWSILWWTAFLATVCVAALNQQAAIVHLMHEAWKTFLATLHY